MKNPVINKNGGDKKAMRTLVLWSLVFFFFPLLMRLPYLQYPAYSLFDEAHYIPLARTINSGGSWDSAHPPLSMAIIGEGIKFFGDRPAGWRIFPVIAGSLGVMLTFLIGYYLGGMRIGLIAAALLSFDPLYYVIGSLAMLDIFMAMFFLGAMLCFIKKFHIGAGVCLGLAMACKWPAFFPFAVIPAILFALLILKKIVFKDFLKYAAIYIVIPLAVYGSIYYLSMPQDSRENIFLRHEKYFKIHMSNSRDSEPSATHPIFWIICPQKIPMISRVSIGPEGNFKIKADIAANPALLWVGFISLFYCIWRFVKTKNPGMALASGGFLFFYLPWFFIGRTSYLFYLTPALPFLFLCSGFLLDRLTGSKPGRMALGFYFIFVVCSFIYLYPILSARPWWTP